MVRPDATDRAVAELLARYDMLAVAVCDDQGHLLGAVTVDDVLDRQLGTAGASATATPTGATNRPSQDGVRRHGEAPRGPHRAACVAAARRRLRRRRVRRFAESIARFLGTARFLVFQTVIIVVWLRGTSLMPDPLAVRPVDRGFVLLTLVLSLQAVVRRPADPARPEPSGGARPRSSPRPTASVAERTQADTEFLARELASVRLMLADVVTGEELRDQLAELTASVAAPCADGLADEPVGGLAADAVDHPQDGIPVNDCRRTP